MTSFPDGRPPEPLRRRRRSEDPGLPPGTEEVQEEWSAFGPATNRRPDQPPSGRPAGAHAGPTGSGGAADVPSAAMPWWARRDQAEAAPWLPPTPDAGVPGLPTPGVHAEEPAAPGWPQEETAVRPPSGDRPWSAEPGGWQESWPAPDDSSWAHGGEQAGGPTRDPVASTWSGGLPAAATPEASGWPVGTEDVGRPGRTIGGDHASWAAFRDAPEVARAEASWPAEDLSWPAAEPSWPSDEPAWTGSVWASAASGEIDLTRADAVDLTGGPAIDLAGTPADAFGGHRTDGAVVPDAPSAPGGRDPQRWGGEPAAAPSSPFPLVADAVPTVVAAAPAAGPADTAATTAFIDLRSPAARESSSPATTDPGRAVELPDPAPTGELTAVTGGPGPVTGGFVPLSASTPGAAAADPDHATAPSAGPPAVPTDGTDQLGGERADDGAEALDAPGADAQPAQTRPRRSRRTPEAAPATTPPRAGRNLPAAIAVGVTLGGAVLASLLFRKEVFIAVAGAAVVLALWELSGAFATKRLAVPVIPLGVGAVGMLVSAFVAGQEGLLIAFTLTAFGVVLWRIIDGLDDAPRDIAAAVFAAAYVPLLASFAVLMLAEDDGPRRLIAFFLVVFASDTGGYIAGVLFGKHPMAPRISPKKSWEGFAGSALGCLAMGGVTVTLLLDGSVLAGLALGAATVVTATLGDLAESLIKRDLGVKDMSSVLPGHGGVMDRMDSLLATAPVACLLLAWLVPAG